MVVMPFMKLFAACLLSLSLSLSAYAGQSPSAMTQPSSLSNAYPPELRKLHENIVTDELSRKPSSDAVKALVTRLQNDGSWIDIDYANQERGGWPAAQHLSRLLDMARAYRNPQSKLKGDPALAQALHAGINYWLEHDFQCPNWWYPEIFVPMTLGPVMLLMEEELTAEETTRGLVLLDRAKIGMTGQNKVWLAGNVLVKALLIKDTDLARQAADAIKSEFVVGPTEGIQADGSFHQHGAQLQMGNYGLAYAGEMPHWIAILRNTPFQTDEAALTILRNYLLNGLQWMTWKHAVDISCCGRQLFPGSQTGKAANVARCLSFMPTIDPAHASDYQRASDYQSLSGNRHFWRSDIQIHRTPDYYFSVKMSSKRVVGSESCNSENLLGFYLGDGAAFLYQTQKEYDNIFPFWNWKRIPGTTTLQDGAPLPLPNKQRMMQEFVGGVSDGAQGIAALDYKRRNLWARKAWFLFGDQIVCLGAGIHSTNRSAVATTINQSYLVGPIEVGCAGQGTPLVGPTHTTLKLDWLLHDNVGYLFPGGTEVVVEAGPVKGSWHRVASRYPDKVETADLLTLGINHGKAPQEGTYGWIIVPHASSTQLADLTRKPPFAIVNRPDRQEVAQSDRSIVGLVFYEAGVSDLVPGMSVSEPCLVMLKKVGDATTAWVSDPTQKLLKLQLTYGGRTVEVSLPTGELAGSSVSVKL